MRIHNFRVGFATNSSSSHSVILLPPDLIGKVSGIATHDDGHYGWDFFRLVSEEEKLRYLAAQFFANYIRDKHAIADIVEKLDAEVSGFKDRYAEVATNAEDIYDCDDSLPSVDHQSVLRLPDNYDPAFAEALIRFFKSPRVVVLGGNDNSDGNDHIKPDGSEEIRFLNNLRDCYDGYRARQDGAFWTLFSTRDGTKIRFSFDRDDLNAEGYVKASAPELVDVKITDWCDKGCAFCYQSSTKAGVHAPLDRIERIVKMLAEMKVFEVAIGGGEPTAHPEFARILRMFHEAGITPNFTTFSNKWLVNAGLVQTVRETVGGIGVSCLSAKDLGLLNEIKATLSGGARWHDGPQITAQHVLGSVPLYVTGNLLTAAFKERHPLLLLGYKPVGFGANHERHDTGEVETFLRMAVYSEENRWVRLSVDTALVDRFPTLTETLGVPDALVTSPEGKFSCYIDAVENLMGPSSYIQKVDMDPLVLDTEAFKAIFARY